MRTKTLLIAAAALAATVISSEAQAVYSANIVGYVNVVAPAGKYVLINNPLTTGNDVITNVIQGAPGGSTLNVWNGTGFTTYTYSALSKSWKNGATVGNNVPLSPGSAFFLNTPTLFTNTFVGNVVPLVGASVTNSLVVGYQPVGSLTPYADVITNASTINLQVAGGSTFEQWNVSAQAFQPLFTYSALAHTWKQGSVATNPVVNVGEGFFVNPSSATNWVQTLPGN